MIVLGGNFLLLLFLLFEFTALQKVNKRQPSCAGAVMYPRTSSTAVFALLDCISLISPRLLLSAVPAQSTFTNAFSGDNRCFCSTVWVSFFSKLKIN